jgi:endonuclease/exonuclease/phosphatase family metal-dependent hydrolase
MRQLCLMLSLTGLRVFGFVSDPWLSSEHIHRMTGEPSRVEHTPAPGENLSVVTWNIERGAAYDAVLAVLRRLDPDVLLLQEVDRGCRRTGYRNVAQDLAVALGMNWVAAGEFQELGEARSGAPAITGQAILSKFTIHDAQGLPFKAQDRWRWSVNPVQPRRGGRLALKARTGGVVFYNTHIESGGNERLQQRQLAEIVADQARAVDGTPVIIAGDFNNKLAPHSLTLRALTGASFIDALGDPEGRGPTSLGQRQPIDWIFGKHMATARGRVIDAAAASDHSPVMTAFGAWRAFEAESHSGDRVVPGVAKPASLPHQPALSAPQLHLPRFHAGEHPLFD